MIYHTDPKHKYGVIINIRLKVLLETKRDVSLCIVSIHQEDKIILSMCTSNNSIKIHKVKKMLEMKGKTNKIIIIVEEFNILLLLVNRTWREKWQE